MWIYSGDKNQLSRIFIYYNLYMIIMKKQKHNNINYIGVSKLEGYVISLMGESGLAVFGVNDVKRLSGLGKGRINNVLFSLHKKGMITRLERNKYVIKENIPGREFEIATSIIIPSYVSFWSALSFYGFTEQQISTIQLVSTKQHKPAKLLDRKIEITKFKPELFYGYVRKDNFNISSKEKAIIDSLSDFEKAGGLEEFAKCLRNSWKELDKKILVEYLLKFGNKSMNSRFGFLIERINMRMDTQVKNKILKNISEGFVRLDPSSAASVKYDKKWRININSDVT